MESKVRQGVTTKVIGNCGFSAAPLNDFLREQILETSPMLREANVKLEWSSMAEYMETIERNGVSLNLAPLVGHGTLRAFVMGYEKRKPTLEAIEIGERAGVPVEISHHKAAGRENWGKVKKSLKLVEEACSRGVEVTCDVYPYTAGSFGLDSVLPPCTHEGGLEGMLKRLKDSNFRQNLKNDMIKGMESWRSVASVIGWENIMMSYCRGIQNMKEK